MNLHWRIISIRPMSDGLNNVVAIEWSETDENGEPRDNPFLIDQIPVSLNADEAEVIDAVNLRARMLETARAQERKQPAQLSALVGRQGTSVAAERGDGDAPDVRDRSREREG